MNISNEDLYQSSDFALVTSLSLFSPIIRLDTDNAGRVIFSFNKTEQLEEIVKDYWNGDLRVDPIRFYSQLKTVKSRLRSIRGGV